MDSQAAIKALGFHFVRSKVVRRSMDSLHHDTTLIFTLLQGTVAYIHTYIIGHYNPSVRIIDLVSYTTYVVCYNFLNISGRTYSL